MACYRGSFTLYFSSNSSGSVRVDGGSNSSFIIITILLNISSKILFNLDQFGYLALLL
jgi:hypothetical protein